MFDAFKLFDSHLHIIDKAYPLQANQGYTPDWFSTADYLSKMRRYQLCGGAIVSGSFQGFDQSYLLSALKSLGESFVGVTQLPNSVSDREIVELDQAGVRAVRFNLKRGGSEDIAHLQTMACRIHEIAGWHVELYVDSVNLPELYPLLIKLPALSIDHLGLSQAGFKYLLRLVEKGVRVKATGFGRVDFPPENALRDLYAANPEALMFGTDLPSTRAPRAYTHSDFTLVIDTLGADAAKKVFSENALRFYQPGNSKNHTGQ